LEETCDVFDLNAQTLKRWLVTQNREL
jgi:hypothetical protein